MLSAILGLLPRMESSRGQSDWAGDAARENEAAADLRDSCYIDGGAGHPSRNRVLVRSTAAVWSTCPI